MISMDSSIDFAREGLAKFLKNSIDSNVATTLNCDVFAIFALVFAIFALKTTAQVPRVDKTQSTDPANSASLR